VRQMALFNRILSWHSMREPRKFFHFGEVKFDLKKKPVEHRLIDLKNLPVDGVDYSEQRKNTGKLTVSSDSTFIFASVGVIDNR
jgi:hypothetical protein